MSIKANELRLGNLVHYNNSEHFIGRISDIGGLTSLGQQFCSIDNRSSVTPITYLKPIPLTEEWMLKLGFIFRKDFTYSDGSKDDVWINGRYLIAKGHEGQPILMRKSNYQILWDFLRVCEFVHQLQNVYHSLTGEELTIKQ